MNQRHRFYYCVFRFLNNTTNICMKNKKQCIMHCFFLYTQTSLYLSSLKYDTPSAAGGCVSRLFIMLVTIRTTIVTMYGRILINSFIAVVDTEKKFGTKYSRLNNIEPRMPQLGFHTEKMTSATASQPYASTVTAMLPMLPPL